MQSRRRLSHTPCVSLIPIEVTSIAATQMVRTPVQSLAAPIAQRKLNPKDATRGVRVRISFATEEKKGAFCCPLKARTLSLASRIRGCSRREFSVLWQYRTRADLGPDKVGIGTLSWLLNTSRRYLVAACSSFGCLPPKAATKPAFIALISADVACVDQQGVRSRMPHLNAEGEDIALLHDQNLERAGRRLVSLQTGR